MREYLGVFVRISLTAFIALMCIKLTPLPASGQEQESSRRIIFKLKRANAPSRAEGIDTRAFPMSYLSKRSPKSLALLEVRARSKTERLKKIFPGETPETHRVGARPGSGPLYAVLSLDTRPGQAAEAICEELLELGELEYCQRDFARTKSALPNDTYIDPDQNGTWSTGAWGNTHADLWGLQAVRGVDAWTSPSCTAAGCYGQNVVAAVVDTGLARTHPDIAANVYRNPGEIAGNNIDDDYNGYIDDVNGWDFHSSDNNPHDGDGHGTHVSGTIAAVHNNGMGIAGVAPRAKILPIKGLSDDGGGYSSRLAAGVVYATTVTDYDKNGRADVPVVINNSWGCSEPCPSDPVVEDAVLTAIQRGGIVIFAAGNSNSDTVNYSPENMADTIVVGAFSHNDTRASFSSYGPMVDFGAPGGGGTGAWTDPSRSILSLLSPGSWMDVNLPTLKVGTQYMRISGTSMAAPHAAGAAAVLLSQRPTLSQYQVEQVLKNSARVIATDRPIGGMIDVYAALAAVAPVPSAPTIVTHPQSRSVARNTSIVLRVVAGGDTPRRYQWQRNGVNIAGATRPNFPMIAVTGNNGARYRCVVTNAQGSVTSNEATITVTNPTATPTPGPGGGGYCSTNGDNDREWINSVRFGSFVNNSGEGGVSGYQDFSTTVAFTAAREAAVNFTFEPAYGALGTQPEFWGIWIDFNRDLDFKDAGEFIYSSNGPVTGPVSGAFRIPSAAPAGSTRMRIRMWWSQLSYADPCGVQVGEVEDYRIDIAGAVASPTPTPTHTSTPTLPPLPHAGGIPATASGVFKGDTNFDRKMDDTTRNLFGDTDPDGFILALFSDGASGPYSAKYNAYPEFKADADNNGRITFDDIDPFIRILEPVEPTALRSFRTELGKPAARTAGAVISGSGRYIVTQLSAPQDRALEGKLFVYDTFSDTSFDLMLPQPYGLNAFLSFDISDDASYLAVTGYTGTTQGFTPYVYRYDLHTGEANLLNGNTGSWYGKISEDGKRIAYRAFEAAVAPSPERQYVFITDFSTSTTRKIVELSPNAIYAYPAWNVDFSNDGRYVLAPMSRTLPITNHLSARGLLLIDTIASTERQLLSGEGTSFSGGHVISMDGNIVVYAKRSGQPRTGIYVHHTQTNTTELLHEFAEDLIPGLSISHDNRYVVAKNMVMHRVTGQKLTLPLPAGDTSNKGAKISGDGRYISFLAEPAGKDSVYIIPNPLYTPAVCE